TKLHENEEQSKDLGGALQQLKDRKSALAGLLERGDLSSDSKTALLGAVDTVSKDITRLQSAQGRLKAEHLDLENARKELDTGGRELGVRRQQAVKELAGAVEHGSEAKITAELVTPARAAR